MADTSNGLSKLGILGQTNDFGFSIKLRPTPSSPVQSDGFTLWPGDFWGDVTAAGSTCGSGRIDPWSKDPDNPARPRDPCATENRYSHQTDLPDFLQDSDNNYIGQDDDKMWEGSSLTSYPDLLDQWKGIESLRFLIGRLSGYDTDWWSALRDELEVLSENYVPDPTDPTTWAKYVLAGMMDLPPETVEVMDIISNFLLYIKNHRAPRSPVNYTALSNFLWSLQNCKTKQLRADWMLAIKKSHDGKFPCAADEKSYENARRDANDCFSELGHKTLPIYEPLDKLFKIGKSGQD